MARPVALLTVLLCLAAACAGEEKPRVDNSRYQRMTVTKELMCEACHAVVHQTLLKLKHQKLTTVNIVNVLDNICDADNFHIYKAVPPAMVRSCEALFEENDDLFMEDLIFKAKEPKEYEVCHMLLDVCKGISYSREGYSDPSTLRNELMHLLRNVGSMLSLPEIKKALEKDAYEGYEAALKMTFEALKRDDALQTSEELSKAVTRLTELFEPVTSMEGGMRARTSLLTRAQNIEEEIENYIKQGKKLGDLTPEAEEKAQTALDKARTTQKYCREHSRELATVFRKLGKELEAEFLNIAPDMGEALKKMEAEEEAKERAHHSAEAHNFNEPAAKHAKRRVEGHAEL